MCADSENEGCANCRIWIAGYIERGMAPLMPFPHSGAGETARKNSRDVWKATVNCWERMEIEEADFPH